MKEYDISNIRRTVLYYPRSIVLDTNWTRQALLYFDEIGSIIPNLTDNYPYSSEMKYLIDEGIYRPFSPESLIYGSKVQAEALWDEFLSIINNEYFIRFAEAYRHDSNNWTIHRNDICSNWIDTIKEAGFFVQDDEDLDYYLFKEPYALLYLSLLAKYLAYTDRSLTIPSTDDLKYEGFIFDPTEKDKQPCLNVYLSGLLPTPTKNVSLKDIILFRNKRYCELLHFRKHIDHFHKKISEAESRQEIKEMIVKFIEEIKESFINFSAVLEESKISTFYSSLKTIISLKSPTFISLSALSGGILSGITEKMTTLPIAVTASGIAVAGFIEIRSHWIKMQGELSKLDRQSEVAFLYYAQQEKIIEKSPTLIRPTHVKRKSDPDRK